MSELKPSVDPAMAGLKGKCPRCGEGPLFRNGLVLREACPNCKLDYAFIDTGDGPSVFAIFIVGFLVLGGALIAEFKFEVPLWFHIVTWGLLTPLLAIMLLRWIKGLLIGQQFKHKAEQGKLHRE
ncbi:MAG TPA: DUF983 domain-containing protein [Hyphomicrobiaceae bacterium]|nr:DUF983 domain-containing protein [Hyphomicrobiaceae bacterium]